MSTKRFLAGGVVAVLMAIGGAAHANAVYTVTLNTGPIDGAAGYAIAFSLQDGSGLGDGNNTVTLSHFAFGSGAPGGAPVLVGDASGSLASSVTLRDSQFSSLFVEAFAPGTSLSFTVDLSTDVDLAAPDFFGFSLLLNGSPLPTLDDTLGDNLLYFNIDSAEPVPFAWATSGQSPVALAPPTAASAPPNGQVPEPGTAWLALLAAFVAGGAGRAAKTRFGLRSVP